LSPYFDFTVSGEEEEVFPARKPSEKIYQIAMQRATTLRGENADQDPNAWVHVGDDLANDIVPARAVGMRTVWLEQIDEGSVGGLSLKQARPGITAGGHQH